MSYDVVAEHVAAWMRRAVRDIAAAELDMTTRPPLGEDALFHCQQAVEKALKGLLTENSTIFTKTHDIKELAGPCISFDRTLEPLLMRASRLTPYAWRYRYPGDDVEPPAAEVADALAVARDVVGAVAQRVAADR